MLISKVEVDLYKIIQKLEDILEKSNSLEEYNIKAKKKVILGIIGHYNVYCSKKDILVEYTNIRQFINYHRELEIRRKAR